MSLYNSRFQLKMDYSQEQMVYFQEDLMMALDELIKSCVEVPKDQDNGDYSLNVAKLKHKLKEIFGEELTGGKKA